MAATVAPLAVRAILFDLDGVLVDSTAAVARAWRAWAQRHGLDEQQVIAEAHGRRSVETIRAVAPHLDPAAETAALEQAEIAGASTTPPLPGARRLLASLPPGSWAVVTSCTRPLATTRIVGAGLPPPGTLVTAEDVTRGKPAPEGYELGAAALGAAAAEAVVIEDTPAGVAAGRAADMPVLALATTYPAAELGEALAVLRTLDDLVVETSADGRLLLRWR